MLSEILQASSKKIIQNISDPFPNIPGDLKLPILGSSIELFLDANKLIVQKWKKYGNIFKIRVAGENMVVLIGAEANGLVLQDTAGNFSAKEGWNFIIGDLFKGAILLSDGEEHARYRRIMQTAFHRDPMLGYIKVIEDTVQHYFDHELTIKNNKLITFPTIDRLLVLIAGKLFFGFDFTTAQVAAIKSIVHASITPLHLEIPFTPYWKGMQARRMLAKFYKEKIKANRKNPSEDIFSQLCVAQSENGEMLSDDEIISQMVFMMMASHDTTTSTITSMIYESAKSIEWQEKMRNESIAFYKEGPINYGRIKDLNNINKVFLECLRLHPALIILPRMAIKEVTFEGHTIPAETRVVLSTYATHIDPKIYSNPLLFDPERFNVERAEHRKVTHSFIPFGAGKHLCLGKYFAEIVAKIVISHFVKRFEWQVPKNYVMQYAPPLSHPKDGLPIFIKRIDK